MHLIHLDVEEVGKGGDASHGGEAEQSVDQRDTGADSAAHAAEV